MISTLRLRAARPPNWAPMTPPTSNSVARTISTDWLVTACSTVAPVIVTRIWKSEVPTTTAGGIRKK